MDTISENNENLLAGGWDLVGHLIFARHVYYVIIIWLELKVIQ